MYFGIFVWFTTSIYAFKKGEKERKRESNDVDRSHMCTLPPDACCACDARVPYNWRRSHPDWEVCSFVDRLYYHFFSPLFVGRWDTNWLLQLFLSFRVPQEIHSWRAKKKNDEKIFEHFFWPYPVFNSNASARSPNLWTGVVSLNLLFFLESEKREEKKRMKKNEREEIDHGLNNRRAQNREKPKR